MLAIENKKRKKLFQEGRINSDTSNVFHSPNRELMKCLLKKISELLQTGECMRFFFFTTSKGSIADYVLTLFYHHVLDMRSTHSLFSSKVSEAGVAPCRPDLKTTMLPSLRDPKIMI